MSQFSSKYIYIYIYIGSLRYGVLSINNISKYIKHWHKHNYVIQISVIVCCIHFQRLVTKGINPPGYTNFDNIYLFLGGGLPPNMVPKKRGGGGHMQSSSTLSAQFLYIMKIHKVFKKYMLLNSA